MNCPTRRLAILCFVAHLPCATSTYAEGATDARAALIVASAEFVSEHCPGLTVSESTRRAAVQAAGIKLEQLESPVFKRLVTAWLNEWRGDPKSSCAAILSTSGPDGNIGRGLVRRTMQGA